MIQTISEHPYPIILASATTTWLSLVESIAAELRAITLLMGCIAAVLTVVVKAFDLYKRARPRVSAWHSRRRATTARGSRVR